MKFQDTRESKMKHEIMRKMKVRKDRRKLKTTELGLKWNIFYPFVVIIRRKFIMDVFLGKLFAPERRSLVASRNLHTSLRIVYYPLAL